MTETILVGFDGNEPSQRAVEFAAARAEKSGAALHLVLVLEWSPYAFLTPEELDERHKRRNEELARAREVVDPVVQKLKARGIEADCETRYGHAAELLCEIAEKRGACQIVVGRTGGSSLAQRLLGGLVVSLVQVAPVPVTVVP